MDGWVVPFDFHVPVKKDGVSGITSRGFQGAEERRKWRSERELEEEVLIWPPHRDGISVLLSWPPRFPMLLGELVLCAKGHPRLRLPLLKVTVRAWLEAGLI